VNICCNRRKIKEADNDQLIECPSDCQKTTLGAVALVCCTLPIRTCSCCLFHSHVDVQGSVMVEGRRMPVAYIRIASSEEHAEAERVRHVTHLSGK
jgi:hypothetical protein